MKTVGLIYGYSARNAGDFAITLGAIDVLLQMGYNLKLFSRYQRQQQDFQEAEKYLKKRYGDKIDVIIDSPFYLDRSSNLLSTLFHYADGAFTIMGLKRNEYFYNSLINCDIVAFNGGNLLRCESFIDYTRLCALLYPLKIAQKAHIPYIIMPQSASKIDSVGRNKITPLIKTASQVFFREKESFDYMSHLIPSDNYRQTIDLAFFINKTSLPKIHRKKVIALTMRFHTVGDIGYMPEKNQSDIFEQMSRYVANFRSQYDFIVVVQTDKDFDKSEAFAKLHGLPIVKSNDPVELLEIYSSVSLLIGMRLHSIILALSVGTPCFGLFYKQWGLKNSGLMNYFNMPYRMMDDTIQSDSDIDSIGDLLSQVNNFSSSIKKIIADEYKFFTGELTKLNDLL